MLGHGWREFGERGKGETDRRKHDIRGDVGEGHVIGKRGSREGVEGVE